MGPRSRVPVFDGPVPAAEQPGIWRRIGDGALFLGGITIQRNPDRPLISPV